MNLELSLQDNQARPPAKKQRFDTSKEAELDQLLDGTTASQPNTLRHMQIRYFAEPQHIF